ncbi:MAG: TolC family protein [Desulfuromonadaceae bacterium]|nr:TolC family protein [Desulfuromonadaceae bacterium]
MTRFTQARGIALALLLSASVCLPVFAESVPRNINEIVAMALKHNAELAALDKEAEAKHSLAIQAGTRSNPTIEFQGSTGSLTGSPDEQAISIGVNQEFSLNDKMQLRREVVERAAEIVRRQRENRARLLKDEITTLALDYSLTMKRQELAAEVVTLNRDLVAIAGERFTAGDIPELDLNITKVELARAESRLLEIERERIPLRIKIASLCGLKESEVVVVDLPSPAKLSQSRENLVTQALSTRPDLLALLRERDRAAAETRLATAEAQPNLSAGLFVQWQRSATELGGMSSVGNDTQLGLRLSLPIPLFDRNSGGKAAAQARQDAAGSYHLALERVVTIEVESAYAGLSSSEKILALFEQGIILQSAENLKLTQEAYRLGEVGILSVVDEQKKFFEVNDGYLAAQQSRRQAFTKLETAVASELTGGGK